MPPSQSLERFRQAMANVYGQFENIPSEDIHQWTAPQNSGGHKGRYLWTDAFGVLNFLTLYKEANEDRYLTLARSLAQTVHGILGRTRDGAARLPGATEQEPLKGGLRIGKEDATGSDGDGQYHHYLTLWMFALNRLSLAAGDPAYNDQAISLAQAIHPRFFVDRSSARPRMVWKIAMDMSRPLVASEGNLDPIDGFVVFRLLQASANHHSALEEEISDYKRVMDRKGEHFVSKDTLDLGMTLWTSQWFAEKEAWAADLGERCVAQLRQLFEQDKHLERSMQRRLAFREFGTALGIGCYRNSDDYLQSRATEIVTSWEKHIETLTPDELRPITMVMYAAALVPGAFRAGYFGPEIVTSI